jgi:hypothetical protein
LHDGSIDTVFRFLGASVFSLTNSEQRQLEQFMFAFDSNLDPIVGQQATVRPTSGTNVSLRADLILERGTLGECDVVVHGVIAGEQRGGVRRLDGTFQLDRASDPPLADAELRALALEPGQEITYMCVPPGSGARMGVDRDEDGVFDRDELDAGTDPADPTDFPGASDVPIRATVLRLRDAEAGANPNKTRLVFRSSPYQGAASGVVIPPWDDAGDPTVGGALLVVSRADGAGAVQITLPAGRWQRVGSPASPGYRYVDRGRIDGPISTVVLRGSKLVIRGKGTGLYRLHDAPQGSMALRLGLGDAVGLCTAVPARLPAAKHDTPTRFNADRADPTC